MARPDARANRIRRRRAAKKMDAWRDRRLLKGFAIFLDTDVGAHLEAIAEVMSTRSEQETTFQEDLEWYEVDRLPGHS
jgi:hypothetical protein